MVFIGIGRPQRVTRSELLINLVSLTGYIYTGFSVASPAGTCVFCVCGGVASPLTRARTHGTGDQRMRDV